MDLLDLMVKIGVDDQASSAIAGIGSKVSGVLGGTANAAAAGVAAAAKAAAAGAAVAAAGVGALTKASLDGYASYEQNVGGIQKLFGNMGQSLEEYAAMTGQTCDEAAAEWQALGNAQDKMLEQAKNAYATCGLSANAYMEQATSFSAALINSLGGDTQKAAEQAQVAMVAMSDNVNTFGTDMQDVQNAFQGFAKQNYTMLDNLKLGYGGTEGEMKRLISDANEYAESIGQASDLSIDSFSDIVTAIDLIQQKQQIAGTTSREAATTIEGSVNMMKAAWENWLTALGSDDYDLGKATDGLAESLVAVADNVLPRVATIVSNIVAELPGLVEEVGPTLADALTTVVGSAAEVLRAAVPEQFRGVFDGIVEQGSKAVAVLSETYQGLDGTVAALGWGGALEVLLADVAQAFGVSKGDAVAFAVAISDTLSPAVEGALGFVQGLADGAASLLGSLSGLAGPAADLGAELGGVLGEALQRAGELIGGLAAQAGEVLVPALADNLIPACQNLLEAIQPWLEPIANVADAFGNILVAAITILVDALSLLIQIISEIIVSVQMLAEGAGAGIDAAIAFFSQLPEAVGGFLQSVIDSVVGWASSMWSQASSAGSGFLSAIGSFLSALPGNVASWLSGVISTVVGWVAQFASNATSAASQFGSSLRDGLAAIPGTLGNIGANIIQGLVNGITGAAGSVVSAVSGVVGDAIATAKGLLGIASPSKLFKKFGFYTMEGMRIGIEQNAGLPLTATERAMAAVADAGSVQMDAPDMRSAAATASVVDWLDSRLGDVIASRTPYIGMRGYDRLARKAVYSA